MLCGERRVKRFHAQRADVALEAVRAHQRNRPKPAIAVTVDLLTTGVDIPDLEFLVFLRPVKSVPAPPAPVAAAPSTTKTVEG